MKKILSVVTIVLIISIVKAQNSPIYNVLDSNSSLGVYILEGPDAPDVQLGIQGNNIKIDLSNAQISNNFNESYHALDTTIHNGSQSFLFQGYIVYQALNSAINPITNFFDTSKMRVVAQSDLQDAADTLVNFYLDTLLNNCIAANMVNGNNQGIQHSYLINKDAFSGAPFQSGNTYCYYVFAYAYNGNKLGQQCSFPWPFLISIKRAGGFGLGPNCLTYNPTSLNEYSSDLGVDFYPNPVKEKIHITFKTNEDYVNIKIINIDGQTLLKKTYSNRNDIVLNITGIASGVCFAKITTNKGQKMVKFTKY